eukprot:Nitzschia sp. Nitz4//scaffold238_size30058//984//2319//NITZ4_007997-RA/size30058-snap-gene-0.68-mRNA-1//-1//CDS//3329543522//4260//frame0
MFTTCSQKPLLVSLHRTIRSFINLLNMTKLAASLLLLHQLVLPMMVVSGGSSHLRRQQAVAFMDEPLAAGEDEAYWSGMMRQMASSMTDSPSSAPTGCMTAIQTEDDIIDILSSISDPALMRQLGTPQNMAMEFLRDHSYLGPCAQEKFWHQRYALSVFYYSTVNNTNLIGWLDGDKSVCEWKEDSRWLISCDDNYNVIQLDCSGRSLDLQGTIPSELQGLSSLQYLFLQGNGFEGTIPSELGTLDQLTSLVLGNNPMEGTLPSELGNLESLTLLSVSNVPFLQGTIPTELLRVNSPLSYVELPGNGLEGTIPTEFGNLINVSVLQLRNNEFSGTIPTELGDLDAMQRLYLSGNLLSGDIPTELGNLDSMERLWLQGSDMALTATMPKEICNVAKLNGLVTEFCSDKSECCSAPYISA